MTLSIHHIIFLLILKPKVCNYPKPCLPNFNLKPTHACNPVQNNLTQKMEDDLKKNGRRPQKKKEDDLKKKRKKMKDEQNKNERRPHKK